MNFQDDLGPIVKAKALVAQRGQLGYSIDGAVVKADLDADRARLGDGTRAPKWALAFKFAAGTATVVQDIEVSVGRTGRLALRAGAAAGCRIGRSIMTEPDASPQTPPLIFNVSTYAAQRTAIVTQLEKLDAPAYEVLMAFQAGHPELFPCGSSFP